MAKAQKRDAAYFKGRLINEFPQAYADFLAGRYSSVTGACKAVGLMSSDTPMKALKRNWLNASGAEKKQFVAWIRARSPSATAVARAPVAALPPAVVGGYAWRKRMANPTSSPRSEIEPGKRGSLIRATGISWRAW
jgi:hypothetical protein